MRRRLRLVLVVVASLAYVGSYIVLSSQGRYVELVCGGADGRQIWYPLGCENRTRSPSGRIKTDDPSLLGWVYLPLLALDQELVHPTQPGLWESAELQAERDELESRSRDEFPFPEEPEPPGGSREPGF